jgi:hypothetical protein
MAATPNRWTPAPAGENFNAVLFPIEGPHLVVKTPGLGTIYLTPNSFRGLVRNAARVNIAPNNTRDWLRMARRNFPNEPLFRHPVNRSRNVLPIFSLIIFFLRLNNMNNAAQKKRIVSLAKQITVLLKTFSKNAAELTELQRLYIHSNLWARNLPLNTNFIATWAQGAKKIDKLKNKLHNNTIETRKLLAQLKSLYPKANVRSLPALINKFSNT